MSGGAAALVLLAAAVAPQPASAGVAAAPHAGPVGKRPYTVTLITGDRVTVGSAGATTGSVHPGPGREHMSFALSSARGHFVVIPADAATLIRARRVDQRLFDVTELISLGYDDAGRATVPLIMRSETGTAAAMKSTLTTGDAHQVRELKAVRGAAVTAPKKRIGSLWNAMTRQSVMRGGVRNVWLDGRLKPSLDRSVPQIGAPAAWQAGYQGEGMNVAILDTGVDATHPDLAGRVTAANFTAEDAIDHVGHGTHVASIIAGDGAASGGKYKGVAPKALILAGKVCEEQGCPESAILAGMQWAAVDQHARVINMSIGGPDTAGLDPMEEAVNTLTAQTGALFVIAAGNSGDRPGTVESPGSADAALTVGAVDKSNVLAPFSSRGPRTSDEAVKPDITAPGVDIVAARAAGTELGAPASDFPDSYVSLDGTSMATPHVAGSAILLAQEHPDWAAGRLKATLMSSAAPQSGADAFQQGAGRVDVAHAITQTVTTEPSSVSFGIQKWPHDNDQALSRTVTYRNGGASGVTLDLTVADPVFSLSTHRVTVPAGGTAEVTITADTRGDVPTGTYTGELVATGGSTSVVTPVGIDKEGERYELTLKHIALDGQPAPNYLTQIFQPEGDYFDLPYDPSGTVTLRVPPGRYTVGTYLDPTSAGTGDWSVLIFQPVVDITGDTTVTFDARKTTPVSQSVPDRTAEPIDIGLLVNTPADGVPVVYGNVAADFDDLRVARLGDPLPFTGWVSSAWVKKGSGEFGYDSPYAYFVSAKVPGDTLLAGYAHGFTRAELATDQQTTHRGAAGSRAYQWQDMVTDNGDFIGQAEAQMHAPGTRTNYLSTGAGINWEATTAIGLRREEGGIDGIYFAGDRHAYRPGQRTATEWGAAPFGTALGTSATLFQRVGEEMAVQLPATGDGAGHPGRAYNRTMKTSLYRGDTLLDEEDGFFVYAGSLPAAAAKYRVVQSSTGDVDGLATRIDVAMTYTSASDQEQVRVIVARATPRLGPNGTAKAGRPGTIPVIVLDQSGRPVHHARVTAEVSFDDGATWKNATAGVTYPRGRGFVSLRLHAHDGSGRSFDQTVIRAYRFG